MAHERNGHISSSEKETCSRESAIKQEERDGERGGRTREFSFSFQAAWRYGGMAA